MDADAVLGWLAKAGVVVSAVVAVLREIRERRKRGSDR
jgi:hypothetical protein